MGSASSKRCSRGDLPVLGRGGLCQGGQRPGGHVVPRGGGRGGPGRIHLELYAFLKCPGCGAGGATMLHGSPQKSARTREASCIDQCASLPRCRGVGPPVLRTAHRAGVRRVLPPSDADGHGHHRRAHAPRRLAPADDALRPAPLLRVADGLRLGAPHPRHGRHRPERGHSLRLDGHAHRDADQSAAGHLPAAAPRLHAPGFCVGCAVRLRWRGQ